MSNIETSILKEYSELSMKMFQLMDNNGNVENQKYLPDISDEELIKSYRTMLLVRVADQMLFSYQRQGRMYTFPPNFGQEAIGVAAGMVMQQEDWLVPAFRELGAWLLKGAALRDIFLYWGGNERGSQFTMAPNFLPSSVPISSQLLHATGIGYSIKYRKQSSSVYTFTGDGGTSQGDFHEALNFASVWKVPVIFTVQNNQYAISVPVSKQTASENIAIKAAAYGMKGIQVDGNDFLALHKTYSEADKYVKAGNGPILIEALTYRRGAHTTSDDPSLYRTKEEEELWGEKDPVDRFRKHLISRELWSEEKDTELQKELKAFVEDEFEAFESASPYKLEEVFDTHYCEKPDILKKQQFDYEQFQKWERSEK